MRIESSLPPVGPDAGATAPARRTVDGRSPPVQPAAAASAELALREANRALAEKGSELAFEFDDASKRVIVKLIDTRTGDVIRQFPSKQMLAIARALDQGRPTGSLVSSDV